MSTLLSLPRGPVPRNGSVDQSNESTDDKVRQQVWALLAGMYPTGTFIERRREQRFPLARLIRLTPVGREGLVPLAEPVVVVGKDVSERGLGFFHRQPLAQRRMIASIETRGGGWVEFLIDIHWCRFTQYGWYDSGGRLLQVVERDPTARGGWEVGRAAGVALPPELAVELPTLAPDSLPPAAR